MAKLSARNIILFVTLGLCTWYFAFFGKESYPFYGDAMGYYMYLPSSLIYHNLKAIDWLPPDKHFDHNVRYYLAEHRREGHYSPRGYLTIKYTYGIAAFELPFFLAAHMYEKFIGGNPDGYCLSYRYMVKASSIFYAWLGVLLLYATLRRFFNDTASMAGACLTLIGTNLFWFALHQSGMAHVPLFLLYAALLYATIRLHEHPLKRWFALAGFAAGLITIIRPTDVLCLLIPLFYGVSDLASARQKLSFLKGNLTGLAIFAVSFVPPIIPQMIYWKKFTGSFLYYSYKGEKFNWTEPRIIAGLFHFNNGWLVYTPLMALALLGLVLYRRIKPVSWLSYIFVPAYIYIIYSWYCYNYINGLGSRPMVNIYPLLAIPFTAMLVYLWEKPLVVRALLLAFVLCCISLNVSYCIQQERGILWSEESNATYNLHMLFKLRANYKDLVVNDVQELQPDESKIEKVATLHCTTNEDSTSDHYVADPTGRSKYIYRQHADEEYYPGIIKAVYDPPSFGGASWIKCSGRFYCVQHFSYFRHLMTLVIKNNRGKEWWWGCRIDNKIGLTEPGVPAEEFNFNHCELNKWGYVYYYVRVPKDIQPGDELWLDVWNIGKMEMWIDDLCLELYRDKK